MPLLSPAALLLDEIARIGSIRRAAERLNASASAVNRQILNLEAELGVAVFERLPRGVRLTAAGELLVTEVRRWRREQERAEGLIRDLKGLRRGHVGIGVMECFVADMMPRAIMRLQRRYPRITVEAFVGGTEQVFDRLVAGTLDAALCFNPPPRQELRTVLTLTAALGLVMARDHPLAGRPSVRLADCAPYSFVLPDRSLAIRGVIDRALRRAAIDEQPVVTTNSTVLMKRLVRGGQHLAVLGQADIYAEIGTGEFAFVPIADDRLPAEELVLCVDRRTAPTPSATILLDIVREELEALPFGRSDAAGEGG